MKTLAFRSLLLALLLLHQASVSGAQESKPSASCNPWSANYRGDVRITSQADADEYTCFRRIIGSLTLVQASATPIVLPKLQGVIGDLNIVFVRTHDHAAAEPGRVLEQLMPRLENVTGRITLEYRGDALLSGVRSPPRHATSPITALGAS